MLNDREYLAERRRVTAGAAAAALISVAVIAVAFPFEGQNNQARMPFSEVVQADLFVGLWLFLAIANVARLRFFSPQDISGSGLSEASPAVRTGNAILQNTLEQTVLALIVHVGIAAIIPNPLRIIIPLVVLFGVGRACFWIAYSRGAAARAFGFALTFYPTVLSLFLLILIIVTGRQPA